ncbi:MAG: ATPase [Deltaproteobacteria bacterium]|jgi:trk system potassium uptake protein TrkH|nr:ATPase [Deltaproteobacteria bacterium]
MTQARTICLGFLILITLGTILLLLPYSNADRQIGNFLISLFTATSAVCVTGLSVVVINEYFSTFGQVIILVLIQLGGLGYMTSSSFLIFMLGGKFSVKQRFNISESLSLTHTNELKHFIMNVILLTLVIEVLGVILLFPVFLEKYDFLYSLWLAIFFSINAFNGGGLSLFHDSLEHFNSWAIYIIIPSLVIIGGIGYNVLEEVYYNLKRILRHKRVNFSLHSKVVFVVTSVLLLTGTVGFYFFEDNHAFAHLDTTYKILSAWFQSVTTRSAGLSTIPQASLNSSSLLLTVVLMFIGASPGGTGGGIKTTTVWVLAAASYAALRGRSKVVSFGREIPNLNILRAVSIVFGSLAMVSVVAILISHLNQELSFIYILYEVFSAFGTVGLSCGITENLDSISQLLLVFTMFVGRINIIILMSALIGGEKPSLVNYPEEKLLIG